MNDDELMNCNETELLDMARRQGLGSLRRGIDKGELVDIVAGVINPGPQHYSGTHETRARLELLILNQWERVRSQLPGCNGKCTSFPCSDGKHAACFAPNKGSV